MVFFCLGLFSSSSFIFSRELLAKAVSTAPICMKGCVTVGREEGGEECVCPVDLYSQLLCYRCDGQPWVNVSLGNVSGNDGFNKTNMLSKERQLIGV